MSTTFGLGVGLHFWGDNSQQGSHTILALTIVMYGRGETVLA